MYKRVSYYKYDIYVTAYSALYCACYAAFIQYFDTRWRFIPYTFAVTLCLAGILFLASRRLRFSVLVATLFFVLMTFVSLAKFKMKGLALHVYDVVFSAADLSLVGFLIENFAGLLLAALVGLLVVIGVGFAAYRLERPQTTPFLVRLTLPVVMGVSAFVMFPLMNHKEEEYLPFLAGYNASALPLSFWNLPDLVTRNALVERVAGTDPAAPFADAVDCRADARRPDLVMVLAESQTSPQRLPGVSLDPDVAKTYLSGDGRMHPLFVETVSGGTWMTNFSVLTGLSTADFGWQAAYVTRSMEGRIRGSLPDVLSRCGYRTVAIMPMESEAMNEGPFLASIGFQEVYDARRLGIPPLTARDKAYFDVAEKLIAEHRRTDKRPLFIEIETMFTHSPYDHVLLPDQSPPEVKPYSASAEANEYLRRVTVARSDLMDFYGKLKQAPGANGTLVAEFGDHHSYATRAMTLDQYAGQEILKDFRSPIYETYAAIHDFGTQFDYAVMKQPEDAAFLVARLMQGSNLPRSPAFEELAKLSDACGGRFHTCPDRRAVDAHLRSRMLAGTLAFD